jgi:hypothetical protein
MTEDELARSMSNEELLNHPGGGPFDREILRRAAPFQAQIETVASHFSTNRVRGAGMSFSSARDRITCFLRKFVVAHGRMPKGQVRVKFLGGCVPYDMGVYDFDILARKGPLPELPIILPDP